MSQIITMNASKSPNYIIKIDNPISERYQIYMLGGFNYNDTTELIGNLGAIVQDLPHRPIYKQSSKLVSPYSIDTNKKRPVIIDVFIDSNGGNVRVLHDITTLLSIAKMRGAIIRTTVLSGAYSCGSLLAIQGTPGFRIMSQNAEHLIHYGRQALDITSDSAKEDALQFIDRNKDKAFSKYEQYTKIPAKILDEIKEYSMDKHLDANTCLKYELCDWIITETGKLKGRTR
ncbi:MAG: ATP-dependent Clp protease proteolytic subunit [Alphaproteobacteria bacterium]|nr:ATP-dependent Clp protease proteolytic subunit [Alphaproteobacteria bacterium]